MNIVRFDHHGVEVSAMEHLKGTHREHCLCFICNKLDIEDRDNNCMIANLLFALDQKCEVTTPVFYCKEFKEKE